MAVPPLGGRMWALPSVQLCRERMIQYFGATLLEHLGCDWAYYQTRALQLRLLREAQYEIPFLEEVDVHSFIGTAQDAVSVATEALEHTCSLLVFGVDFPVLSFAEVENLLLSVTTA
ncbi:hypothetical protein NDU88_001998 [Pleurodeles waltl]|uniref:Uncharacterized protein n=1 Tax=Pleurodeles waltl TaxID=8319 RepID=A0AAV7SBN5_PLEWA|nr:hypothetical protein NDU88_001998 [Pleurodeles waltl]